MASEQEGLITQLETSIKRLNALREDYAIQSDPDQRFTLKLKIEKLEREIADLKLQLENYDIDTIKNLPTNKSAKQNPKEKPQNTAIWVALITAFATILVALIQNFKNDNNVNKEKIEHSKKDSTHIRKITPDSSQNGTAGGNGSTEPSEERKPKEDLPQKQTRFYVVKLSLPEYMEGAKILIDGKNATILDQAATWIRIRIPTKETNYKIRVEKEGKTPCTKQTTITKDSSEIILCY